MFKVFGLTILLGSIFWAGYYVGQQPPGEVKHKLRTMSEDMVERALGLDESRLLLQREYLEAKARVVQCKANLIDGQYDQAANEMGLALVHLKKAVTTEGETTSSAITDQLLTKVEDMKDRLASGQVIPRQTIDEVQTSLDNLMAD